MKMISFFLMGLLLVSCAHEEPFSNPEAKTHADAIRNVLISNTPKFRSCYRAEVDSSSSPQNLEGRVDLKFKVDENGRVSQSSITSKDIKEGLATKCIKNILDELQFPKPIDGKGYEVLQPLNVRPAPVGHII